MDRQMSDSGHSPEEKRKDLVASQAFQDCDGLRRPNLA